MKDLIILVLIFIVAFLVWNSRVNISGYMPPVSTDGNTPVPPDVIEAIIDKIRQSKPDEFPIDTLFITPQGNGSYSSRIMFYNTKYFMGNQYDVQAKVNDNGSVDIQNISSSAAPDPNVGYKPDTYKPYEEIKASTSNQLKTLLATRPETPVITSLSLGTRA
jgi:hypothetical protein